MRRLSLIHIDKANLRKGILGERCTNSCDALRARIENTLLIDLPEEEKSSMVEHVKSCSACAELFREYQLIEEFASQLPNYNLRVYKRHQDVKPGKKGVSMNKVYETVSNHWTGGMITKVDFRVTLEEARTQIATLAVLVMVLLKGVYMRIVAVAWLPNHTQDEE